MKGLNMTETYTKDSQKFMLENDNFRDLPMNIVQSLVLAENINDKITEIKEGIILIG